MRDAVRRLPIERSVPVGVAATIFAVAAGSSSVVAVKEVGSWARWAFLLGLLGLATAAAAGHPGRPRLSELPWLPAAAFVALALLSSLWSVDPPLSAARATSVGVMLAVAASLAYACTARVELAERVLVGVVAAAAAVAVAGLVVLAVLPDTAVFPATTETAARFRGFGENPNTAALLHALALPAAAWGALRAGGRAGRAAAAGAFLLLAGSIAASGSRAALVGGFAGAVAVVVVTARPWPTRLALAGGVLALGAAALALSQLPDPLPIPPDRAAATETRTVLDADLIRPVGEEIGREPGAPPLSRSLLGGSGRAAAWRGALDEAADRPLLGYGFGTESQAFVDRFYAFVGSVPENSYLGLLLQTGGVGLALFLAVVAAFAVRGLQGWRRVGRRERAAAAAAGGVAAVGLLVAVVQSYLYAAGNIAALAFWLGLFTLAAVTTPGRTRDA